MCVCEIERERGWGPYVSGGEEGEGAVGARALRRENGRRDVAHLVSHSLSSVLDTLSSVLGTPVSVLDTHLRVKDTLSSVLDTLLSVWGARALRRENGRRDVPHLVSGAVD